MRTELFAVFSDGFFCQDLRRLRWDSSALLARLDQEAEASGHVHESAAAATSGECLQQELERLIGDACDGCCVVRLSSRSVQQLNASETSAEPKGIGHKSSTLLPENPAQQMELQIVDDEES